MTESERAIKRIIDANLDRAREGLRIVEEWCRFGLEDREMGRECKEMRQELGTWHTIELKLARDTPNDVGTTLTHPEEENRESIGNLLQVNLGRVQEALRVLEEYGKLYNREMAASCKGLRYRVYALESRLINPRPMERLKASPLYFVTSPEENLSAIVESALEGGLKLVQYRNKTADDTVRLEEARRLRELCHRYGALFIMNDRVDLARAIDADGVHLGQNDLPIAVAREFLGTKAIIGRSTTNPIEMEKALKEGADYVGVGPVYETPTKPGKAAAGFEYIRYAIENCPIPWYAIGGIDGENIDKVIAAGAGRVAVVRAIARSSDPRKTTEELLRKLKT